MMAAPRRVGRSRFDGGDFDRIAAWAQDHLCELVREVHPGWGKGPAGQVRGPCFLHDGTNPNLAVTDGEGWICHKCGEKGGGVDLWRRLRFGHMREPEGRLEALRDLAHRAGVRLGSASPRARSFAPSPRIVEKSAGKSAAKSPVDRASTHATFQAELRASGTLPADPSMIYGAVLDALQRTDAGDAVLAARGFDPADAYAYGFRTVDDAASWRRLGDTLADSFLPADLMAAGFVRQRQDGAPEVRLCPWWPDVPALVIPYQYRGATVALRFRASTVDTPKAGRYRSLAGVETRVPFNADALDQAAGQVVHVAEGELNAYALSTYGIRVIGLPGAGTWRDRWTEALRDVHHLVTWYDADAAGAKGQQKLAQTLLDAFGVDWLRTRGLIRDLPSGNDVNDLHRDGSLARFLETVPA